MVVIWFNSSRLNNVIENLLQGRQRKGNARRRWRSFFGKIEEMMCKHTHQKKKIQINMSSGDNDWQETEGGLIYLFVSIWKDGVTSPWGPSTSEHGKRYRSPAQWESEPSQSAQTAMSSQSGGERIRLYDTTFHVMFIYVTKTRTGTFDFSHFPIFPQTHNKVTL